MAEKYVYLKDRTAWWYRFFESVGLFIVVGVALMAASHSGGGFWTVLLNTVRNFGQVG